MKIGNYVFDGPAIKDGADEWWPVACASAPGEYFRHYQVSADGKKVRRSIGGAVSFATFSGTEEAFGAIREDAADRGFYWFGGVGDEN